jgi:hypothetical protein
MAKNRVIYQSDALFRSQDVNSNTTGAHRQLRRVQSANYNLNVTREDLLQFGALARIDSVILESPTVPIDFSYYLGDGYNEEVLGLSNDASFGVGFVSGLISSDSAAGSSGNNFYILTAPEGRDLNFNSPQDDGYTTIGVGNAFLTDYSLEAAVGGFPTVTVSLEGSNMNATDPVTLNATSGYLGITGAGINPEDGSVLASQVGGGISLPFGDQGTGAGIPTALRPGDISLTLGNDKSIAVIDGSADAGHVQSVSLSVPLSRSTIDRLGSKFSFARVADFPIEPTLSVNAIVNEMVSRRLTDLVDDDSFIPFLQLTFNDTDGTPAASYKMTNVKLNSESYTSSIGPNKTVDLEFSLSIGGPADTDNNVFFSGSNGVSPIYT